MYDIQNRCIPDEIDLFSFKTCIITHNNNVIEQNINVSMFDILSVKEPHNIVCPAHVFHHIDTALTVIDLPLLCAKGSGIATG